MRKSKRCMGYKNRPDRFYRDTSQFRFCVHDWSRLNMAAWKPVRSYVGEIKAFKSAREETMSATPSGEIVRVEGEIDERVKSLYGL